MKTPTEIANSLMRPDGVGGMYTLSEGEMTIYGIPERDANLARHAMVAAINTDRAQHFTLDAAEIELVDKVLALLDDLGTLRGAGKSRLRRRIAEFRS